MHSTIHSESSRDSLKFVDTCKCTLETLLSDPKMLPLFRDFAVQEHSADWLFFWCDAEKYPLQQIDPLGVLLFQHTTTSSSYYCDDGGRFTLKMIN